MLTESPNQQALREFGSNTCAVDGTGKREKQSFCFFCYKNLPANMQKALWRRFGSGYEEAYFEAKEFLLEERKAGKSDYAIR